MLPVETIIFPPPIILFLIIWTFDMREKCSCAVDWRLTAMQVMLFFFLLTPEKGDEFVTLLRKPIALAKLFYLAVALSYVTDVEKKTDCECSKTTPFRVLFWVSAIQIAIFTGSFLLAMYKKINGQNPGKWMSLS